MAFWRWVLALLLLLPFVLRPMYEQRALLRANWVRLALLGVLGVGCYNTFLYAALQTTTATNGVLINSMTPLLIVLIGRVLFGVTDDGPAAGRHPAVAGGIVGIVSRGDIAVLMQLDFNQGDLLLVGGALTWALYTVLLRWRPAGIDTLAFLGAAVVGGIVLLMLPLYLVELASGRVAVWNAATGAGMVYFAVFPSILSYLFWNRGVQQVGANRAGLFLYLVPVFGVVLAVTFLGERLHIFHLAGAALIFTGIAMSTTGASGAKGHCAKHVDSAGDHGLIGHLPTAAVPAALPAGRRNRLICEERQTRSGRLFVVGIGPGGPLDRTRRAVEAITASDCVVGYTRYMKLVSDLTAGKELIATGMTHETERCRLALTRAQGREDRRADLLGRSGRLRDGRPRPGAGRLRGDRRPHRDRPGRHRRERPCCAPRCAAHVRLRGPEHERPPRPLGADPQAAGGRRGRRSRRRHLQPPVTEAHPAARRGGSDLPRPPSRDDPRGHRHCPGVAGRTDPPVRPGPLPGAPHRDAERRHHREPLHKADRRVVCHAPGVWRMILLIGGTSETAPLASGLAAAGYEVLVSTATDVPLAIGEPPRIQRRTGRLDEEGLVALAKETGIRAIVDAAHPYAAAAHAAAQNAAKRLEVPCLRFSRPETLFPESWDIETRPAGSTAGGPESADTSVRFAADHREAAELAFADGRPVLITTGSRNLAPYVEAARRTDIPLTVRVLDAPESLAACRAVGIAEDRIIAGRGPFTLEENLAAIRRFQIGVLVTKKSGRAGGLDAKLAAAHQANCRVIVLSRPETPHTEFTFESPAALIAVLQNLVPL